MFVASFKCTPGAIRMKQQMLEPAWDTCVLRSSRRRTRKPSYRGYFFPEIKISPQTEPNPSGHQSVLNSLKILDVEELEDMKYVQEADLA
ncbi:hypothetical protein DPEC_G00097600 [Dallia pectoralis]|uniref:Uncharacterized protein n=1 Tax=Dallia pectoralis TaxID=75939 RepID=A0ACC2GWI4_DALPE|nr:hypothetical protein DPEC_G00097600 [Dallia pectoralis]